MPLKFKFLTLSQSNPLNVVLGTVHAILGASVDFHQGSYADERFADPGLCCQKNRCQPRHCFTSSLSIYDYHLFVAICI